MEIHFFDKKIEKFISSLDQSTIAKVLRTIDLLTKFGHTLGMPHSKPLMGGLFELRIRGVQEVRILYAFHSHGAILVHGFVKKSQKIPERELSVALSKKKLLDEG
ncbi:type II toxin-antitoxin system RelE/ParE family toxin [Candidatus Uhrbacteria bacterium]|nr:type II toxin-antitoxin system RelE/ParE family toxin [Candidatus Uhrbacteria bacterium]